jgi:hypothetical protein
MSRWGEMFQALSRPVDTADTADTNPAPSEDSPFVSAESAVSWGENREKGAYAAEDAGQPIVAEIDDRP